MFKRIKKSVNLHFRSKDLDFELRFGPKKTNKQTNNNNEYIFCLSFEILAAEINHHRKKVKNIDETMTMSRLQ